MIFKIPSSLIHVMVLGVFHLSRDMKGPRAGRGHAACSWPSLGAGRSSPGHVLLTASTGWLLELGLSQDTRPLSRLHHQYEEPKLGLVTPALAAVSV